jgi:transcriptional regulator with XRE-family HTH domain
MARDSQEDAVRDSTVGESEPALRGGGWPLPALKYWRKRRGLSQVELARRADLGNDYIFRVESGRRGCNPDTARLLASLLEVDLQDLRSMPDDALDTKAPSDPSRSKVVYRFVHRAYLKIILEGAVGSSYAAMDEREVEDRCERGTWEGALEIIRARKREIEYLKDALGARVVLRDPDLPDPVRLFLEGVLESFPDLDIHLLAMARRREPSEEGHEALTKAMRDLL